MSSTHIHREHSRTAYTTTSYHSLPMHPRDTKAKNVSLLKEIEGLQDQLKKKDEQLKEVKSRKQNVLGEIVARKGKQQVPPPWTPISLDRTLNAKEAKKQKEKTKQVKSVVLSVRTRSERERERLTHTREPASTCMYIFRLSHMIGTHVF